MRANIHQRIDANNRFVIIGESEKKETMFFDRKEEKIIHSPFNYNLIKIKKWMNLK